MDDAIGLPWCSCCGGDVVELVPGCPRCGAPKPVGSGPCPLGDSAVAATVAAHPWGGTVAAVVRTGKLDGCHRVFPQLGRPVAAAIAVQGRDWPGIDMVCAVPADPRRRRRRGFDHAAMVARAVAGELAVPHVRVLRLAGRSVDRGAASRADPAAGVDRVWAATADIRATGRVAGHVVLVDDVVTTGTTVAAAATVLRTAGADRVSVAAVARAGGH